VENNQPINFEHNQTMHYIIFHIEMVGWEILVLCTRCHKSFITYQKSNGIITKKKHIEMNEKALYKKCAKEVNATNWVTISPFAWKLTTKRPHMNRFATSRFFFVYKHL
jgi:hypothetical protein